MTSSSELALVKILFEDGQESMWAQDLGEGLYRIDNAPFLTYLVSCYDIVRAIQVPSAADGFLQFTEVYARGGHNTFRVWIAEGEKELEDAGHLLKTLQDCGCYVESHSKRLKAIDVPPLPVADMDIIWGILAHSEDDKIWEFECGYNATTPPWQREAKPEPEA